MPLALKCLLPPGGTATAAEIVAGLGLLAPAAAATPGPAAGPSARPRLLLNMVSTVDGRATIGGRSGPLGNEADRDLFHGLRTVVDAVLVGAGTARTEHYRRLIRDPSARARRRRCGLAEEPLACIVSGRLALGGDIPLLADPEARVAILTPSAASLPTSGGSIGTDIAYIRARRADGQLDLPAALAEVGERFAVKTILCEGGPHLNGQLLAAGLVDELFLSFAPKLAGGDATGEALRILTGVDLDPPVELELLGVLESQSHLFLRYAVRRPAALPSAKVPAERPGAPAE